jgi:hypothetical protein
VRAVEPVFLKTLKDPVLRRRSREDANDPKADPLDHLAQHDRRRPVHARGPSKKAQADPCPEELPGEPVAILESVAP